MHILQSTEEQRIAEAIPSEWLHLARFKRRFCEEGIQTFEEIGKPYSFRFRIIPRQLSRRFFTFRIEIQRVLFLDGQR